METPKEASGTCQGCTYWGRYRDQECDKSQWHERRSTLAGDDFGVVAFAPDDHGLDAYLKTGPDFGCVHFKPKNRDE